jgi:hypothetical protein
LQVWQQIIKEIESEVSQFPLSALNPFATLPLTKVNAALQRYYPR